MKKILLKWSQWFSMCKHVSKEDPLEACGMLSGINGIVECVYPVENVAHSPVRFQMNPLQQFQLMKEIERDGNDLLGFYHSHPSGPSDPSELDINEFSYPGVISIVWSKDLAGEWTVRCFSIEEGKNKELTLQLIDE